MPDEPPPPEDFCHDSWLGDYQLEAVLIPDEDKITLRPLLSPTRIDHIPSLAVVVDLLLLYTRDLAKDGHRFAVS